MTEAQAYKVVGWPLEGGRFILPCGEDTGDEWFAAHCFSCHYSLVFRYPGKTRATLEVTPCPGCGEPMEIAEGPLEAEQGRAEAASHS